MSTAPAWEELVGLLDRRRTERPGGLAAVSGDRGSRSWAEAATVAEQVRDRVKGCRRVGLWAPNGPDWLAVLHGCWQAGATAVVVSSLAPAPEAAHILTEAGVDAVLASGEESTALAGAGAPGPSWWPGVPGPAEPGPLAPLESGPEANAAPDAALVLFTSGTTGRPKGIVHSGAALTATLAAMAGSAGLDRDRARALDSTDRRPSLVLTPLSHTSGLLGSLFAWWVGKPVAVLRRFGPEALDEAVARFGVRALRLVPTMVHDLVAAGPEVTLAGVRTATVGTAALTPGLRQRFEARFGFPLLVTYGQTEAMGGVAAERLDDVRAGRRPSGSVGRALPGIDLRIIDLTTGAALPPGTMGEITVHSTQVLAGYLDGAPPPVDAGGYLRTGDLGHLDADGFLFVTGRAGDVIVSGGFNVYPSEVEEVLARRSGVSEVAVVGLPDERLGEVPVAAVVGDRAACTPGDLDLAVRADLAPYKRPRAYAFLTALPRTAAGKVDRATLAAIAYQPVEAPLGRSEP